MKTFANIIFLLVYFSVIIVSLIAAIFFFKNSYLSGFSMMIFFFGGVLSLYFIEKLAHSQRGTDFGTYMYNILKMNEYDTTRSKENIEECS